MRKIGFFYSPFLFPSLLLLTSNTFSDSQKIPITTFEKGGGENNEY